MRVTDYKDAATAERGLTLWLTNIDRSGYFKVVIERAIQIAAEHLAAVWLEDHQQELLAKLDPQAVANLAVAASGAAVRDMLGKKMPDVVQHHHHDSDPQVYQRGIFGGLKKIR